MTESISQPAKSLRPCSEPCEPTIKLGEGKLGHPQWAGYYLLEWEILVYEQEEYWEACFFNWNGHHEHVQAVSLSEARRKAKDRIELLEAEMAGNRSVLMANEVAAISPGPRPGTEDSCETIGTPYARSRAKGVR